MLYLVIAFLLPWHQTLIYYKSTIKVQKMKQKNTNLNEAKDWKEILKEAENKLKIE